MMNEAELERLYAASFNPTRTALLAPYGEFALALAQAATAWRKTLTLDQRQTAAALTHLDQTLTLFRDWLITQKPQTKAAQGLRKQEGDAQALITLLARDALEDKYALGPITHAPQFADPTVARRVIQAENRDISRKAAFEALGHAQKTLAAIPDNDLLSLDLRAEIFTNALHDRIGEFLSDWVLPVLASIATRPALGSDPDHPL